MTLLTPPASTRAGLILPKSSEAVAWRIDDAPVPYATALAAMEARAEAVARGEARELVWLLEHPPLYTAGTSARPEHLPAEGGPIPVHRANRGGQVTYHGPGQRIAYVILDLRRRERDVRRFVSALEDWLIQMLAAFSVRGERREKRVGVWVPRPEKGEGREDKIAAIGVRVRGWVTFHGISLNVDPDLSHFDAITPCGVADQGVTSLWDLGRLVSTPEVDMVLRQEFEDSFAPTMNES